MNILIPMAGSGIRFENAGFKKPKPLIDVDGKPMIQYVVENLLDNDINGKFIFVVQEDHKKHGVEKVLKTLVSDCEILYVPELTEGQLCSAFHAEHLIDNDEPLLIVNSDNFFIWNGYDFKEKIKDSGVDGTIVTFNDPYHRSHWSFAGVDSNDIVTQVCEKNPISDHALAGAFVWNRGKDFIKYGKHLIEKKITVNGEYFIAPVFNEAIQDGRTIKNYKIETMISMGTPSELEIFKKWKSMPRKWQKMQEIIDDVNRGVPIILVDEYDRENEGDLVVAVEKANVDNIAFTMLHARGLMCIPCNGSYLDRLKLPPMVKENTDKNETPFSVSVDAIEGVSTGMSVYDRLKTMSVLLDENSKPEELSRPGHLFPLRARDALLKERRGHTEGSVALMELCGLKPMAMICEIINDDGTMASGEDLEVFAEKHGIKIISIEEIYEATYNERL